MGQKAEKNPACVTGAIEAQEHEGSGAVCASQIATSLLNLLPTWPSRQLPKPPRLAGCSCLGGQLIAFFSFCIMRLRLRLRLGRAHAAERGDAASCRPARIAIARVAVCELCVAVAAAPRPLGTVVVGAAALVHNGRREGSHSTTSRPCTEPRVPLADRCRAQTTATHDGHGVPGARPASCTRRAPCDRAL